MLVQGFPLILIILAKLFETSIKHVGKVSHQHGEAWKSLKAEVVGVRSRAWGTQHWLRLDGSALVQPFRLSSHLWESLIIALLQEGRDFGPTPE